MAIDPNKLGKDVEKAFADAMVGSNAEVQKRGPGVASAMKKWGLFAIGGAVLLLGILAAFGVRF